MRQLHFCSSLTEKKLPFLIDVTDHSLFYLEPWTVLTVLFRTTPSNSQTHHSPIYHSTALRAEQLFWVANPPPLYLAGSGSFGIWHRSCMTVRLILFLSVWMLLYFSNNPLHVLQFSYFLALVYLVELLALFCCGFEFYLKTNALLLSLWILLYSQITLCMFFNFPTFSLGSYVWSNFCVFINLCFSVFPIRNSMSWIVEYWSFPALYLGTIPGMLLWKSYSQT